MKKELKKELDFYDYVLKKMDIHDWTIKDLKDIYSKWLHLIKMYKTDELSVLRKGEIFLGEYTDKVISYTNMIDIKYFIYSIVEAASEDLDVSVGIVIIGTVIKLSLNKLENVKEE